MTSSYQTPNRTPSQSNNNYLNISSNSCNITAQNTGTIPITEKSLNKIKKILFEVETEEQAEGFLLPENLYNYIRSKEVKPAKTDLRSIKQNLHKGKYQSVESFYIELCGLFEFYLENYDKKSDEYRNAKLLTYIIKEKFEENFNRKFEREISRIQNASEICSTNQPEKTQGSYVSVIDKLKLRHYIARNEESLPKIVSFIHSRNKEMCRDAKETVELKLEMIDKQLYDDLFDFIYSLV